MPASEHGYPPHLLAFRRGAPKKPMKNCTPIGDSPAAKKALAAISPQLPFDPPRSHSFADSRWWSSSAVHQDRARGADSVGLWQLFIIHLQAVLHEA